MLVCDDAQSGSQMHDKNELSQLLTSETNLQAWLSCNLLMPDEVQSQMADYVVMEVGVNFLAMVLMCFWLA